MLDVVTRHLNKKRAVLVVIVLAIILVPSGGTGDSPDESDPVATDTPSAELEAVQSAKSGLSDGSSWNDETREVSVEEGPNNTTTLDVRYNLQTDTLGGEFDSDEAEKRAGFTARNVLQSIEGEDVDRLAIYAYVPTEDGGDTVSTKIVIDAEKAESIDFDSCAWKCVREEASQYKHNSYLY